MNGEKNGEKRGTKRQEIISEEGNRLGERSSESCLYDGSGMRSGERLREKNKKKIGIICARDNRLVTSSAPLWYCDKRRVEGSNLIQILMLIYK